jgi:uncharacterized membrane protein YuzA (DUF378 family)
VDLRRSSRSWNYWRKALRNQNKLTVVLLIAGGLNWGLIGLFNFNLVTSVLGGLGRLVFLLVGWAAIYQLFNWSRIEDR